MDIETMTRFFMWCTIINGGILILWSIFFLLTPDFVYRLQNRFFPIARETYNLIIYSLLGVFKILFLVFSVVPYVALLIVA